MAEKIYQKNVAIPTPRLVKPAVMAWDEDEKKEIVVEKAVFEKTTAKYLKIKWIPVVMYATEKEYLDETNDLYKNYAMYVPIPHWNKTEAEILAMQDHKGAKIVE